MSTFYDSPNDYRNYLEHHGVKGMKWGVRHDKISQGVKKRKMKKYNITSKEYDETKKAAKLKSGPVKAITTIQGGLMGGMFGAASRLSAAKKAGAKAAQEWIRSGTDHTINAGIQSGTGAHVFTTASSNARAQAERAVLGSAAQIAKIPIGAAAGSALGYAGGRILEEIIANDMMSEVGLRRDNRTYNNLREYDVRLKRD